jgi:hypothetical protein
MGEKGGIFRVFYFVFLLFRNMIVTKIPPNTIATTKPMRYVAFMLKADGDCVGVGDELVGLGVGDTVGLGEGVGDLVGVGVGTGVGVGVAAGITAKLAVIFPGPFIVAVVEPAFEFPNVMLPVSVDHEENL